jgi:hypothetical protein
MLKGFGIIALCLAAEAAFLFHAALPAGIPPSTPRAGAAVDPLVRVAMPPASTSGGSRAAVAPCAVGTTRC